MPNGAWKAAYRLVSHRRSAAIREGVKGSDVVDDQASYPMCRIGTGLGDVVADALEVVRGVRRPADAHQPR
jgi:hypothetical protein